MDFSDIFGSFFFLNRTIDSTPTHPQKGLQLEPVSRNKAEHRGKILFDFAEDFSAARVGEKRFRLAEVDPIEIAGGNVHEVKNLAGRCAEREQELVKLRSPPSLALDRDRAVCKESERQMTSGS